VSAFLAGCWDQGGDDADRNFGSFARRTFAIIDWVPVRLTAASFAIVGNFEDAVDCWRVQADKWPADGLSIVVASGAGALGVQLGTQASRAAERSAIGSGDEPDVDFMASTVGLVWRALVLWLLVLLLFGLASLVGG
jgi:cobalamin biosynthesis protein CobD/CbiB